MAKKTIADLMTSEAPESAPKSIPPPAKPQAFPGLSPTAVNREVRCIGGGPYDGTWTVPAPIPQEISAGRAVYNLSDRAAGLYVYRIP